MSRHPRLVVAAVTLAVASTAFTALAPAEAHPAAPAGTAAPPDGHRSAEHQALRAWAQMPLGFERNRGQTDAAAAYVAHGEGFSLYLTRRGPVFDLQADPAAKGAGTERRAGVAGVAVALRPVGARRAPTLVATQRQAGSASYFRGDDPSRWQRGVRTFGRVTYRGLYRGVDMVVRGRRSGAEYDFVVAPGADPSRIGYRLDGAAGLRLAHGDLVASTAVGDFVHHAPVAYQRVDGQRRLVDARFRLVHGVVRFALGSYDPSRPLVIDPETEVDYGTFLGGADGDGAFSIALDGGDVYLTGYTRSAEFPTTTGAYDATFEDNSDVFVARISPDGAGSADLVYSTYLGGSGNATYDDEGYDIAVADGDVYLTGRTFSPDFPTTAGALDGTMSGDRDGFFAKISPDGAGAADLAYSTFVGGSGEDYTRGIAVAGGDAYLTGWTSSDDFPTTPGAYDTTLSGSDVFVARISPDGAGADDLTYSTFLGASGGFPSGTGIAVADGDVFVTGSVWGDFPTTAGAYDRTSNGASDIFVVQLSPDSAGSADLVYATLIGGEDNDDAMDLTLDGGDVYLTGGTRSREWPTTAGAHDRSYAHDSDAVVARLSLDGAGAADLVYSTFLDVLEWDLGDDIDVEDGNVYVVGTSEIYDKYGGGYDAFLAMLSPVGGGAGDLVSLEVLGDGFDDDDGGGVVVDGGTVYVTGSTTSYGTPTTPGAYDTSGSGDPWGDVFLALLRPADNQVWPDGFIRRGDRPDVGDDVFGSSAAQTVVARVRRRHERVFWVTAQNDDNHPDTLTVRGSGTKAARWVVRFYRDGVDVTDEVGGAGYQTQELATGEAEVFRVTIKPRRTAKVGSAKDVVVTVTSGTDPDVDDAVRARVTVRRG